MTPLTHPTRTRLADPLAPVTDLTGRRAVVTGGSSGLGLVTTRALLRGGAAVVIGARDTSRAERARDRLVAELNLQAGRLTVAPLDLIDPPSVRGFAKTLGDAALDLLGLNAGISSVSLRHDHAGIESQFATNHLGHFALTGHLFSVLERGTDARVVTVSSALYSGAKLDLDDLSDLTTYSPGRAYSRSKLANVIFALELQRRLASEGSTTRSFAAHPGMARTPLHATYPSAATRILTSALARVIGRDPEPADVGVMTAALSPEASPGAVLRANRLQDHPGRSRAAVRSHGLRRRQSGSPLVKVGATVRRQVSELKTQTLRLRAEVALGECTITTIMRE